LTHAAKGLEIDLKTITASEFRRNCLKVLDEVRTTRESVVITKNGRPVLKLVPMDNEAKGFLGCLAGVIEIVGDIESPVEPPEAWEVLR
jgi:prevent-host-death family protein